jgi:hypothetical protein
MNSRLFSNDAAHLRIMPRPDARLGAGAAPPDRRDVLSENYWREEPGLICSKEEAVFIRNPHKTENTLKRLTTGESRSVNTTQRPVLYGRNSGRRVYTDSRYT